MERNCGIFLAGDDALGYLAKPNHKIFQDIISGIHLIRADLMSNFSIFPHPPLRACTSLEYPRLVRMRSYRFDAPLFRFDFARLREFPQIVLPQKFRNS